MQPATPQISFRAFLLGIALLFGAMAASPLLAQSTAEEAPVYEEMALGDPDAPITVVEYLSFTCPHCATFHNSVFKQLKPDYIDTGKIRFVFREVYFDPYGLWAGILARCGGNQKYFGLVDMLFQRQSSWSRQPDGPSVAARLFEIGRAAGLADSTIQACFQDGPNAELLVEKFKEFTEEDGINSTPSFVIDGTNYSNMGLDEFVDVLESKL